jgi:hypothetical protein
MISDYRLIEDFLGKRAIVYRDNRKSSWRGILGHASDATVFCVRDGSVLLVVFTLAEVMPPVRRTLDGLLIQIIS